jgi:methionine-rich copper-binding protein CopC
MRLPFKGGSKLQCRKISGKLPAKTLPTLTDSSVEAMTQLTKLSTQLTLMFEDGVWPKGSNMAISLFHNWNVSHGE